MKDISRMTQAELAAYVQSYLRKKGIIVVLSGGAVVGIYSKGQYVSKDIGFVNA
jgi:molybdate-binding protein